MKIKFLEGCAWGAEVSDIDLRLADQKELKEIVNLVLTNLVVVIRGQKLSPYDEVRITRMIGGVEEMPESIWHRCPKINGKVIVEIQRVTGERDNSGKPTGLFGHNADLDWHANRASSAKDRKPFVWLYSVRGSSGSRTSWLNFELAYQDLSNEWRASLKNKKGFFGYEPNRYSSFDEFKTHINKESIPLVHENPMTEKVGLYFPFLQLFGIEGLSDRESSRYIEDLKTMVVKEKYMYHHNWQDGDVVISEQWLTIHKRWACDVSNRLLHRITMGYENVV